jgi:hypothetical protein
VSSGFKVYYSSSMNGSYKEINANNFANGCTYTLDNLVEGTLYWAKVSITNTCGTIYSAAASI